MTEFCILEKSILVWNAFNKFILLEQGNKGQNITLLVLLLSLESQKFCYSCDFCDIGNESKAFSCQEKSLLLLQILRYLQTFRGPS